MFAATDFEFKNRFWMIGAIFFLAFATYGIDHQTAGGALVDWLCHLRGVEATTADYRLIFGVAALFCCIGALIRTWGTAYLNSEVMIAGQLQTASLVADGPYRHVRNPLYFGNVLLAFGYGLMASRIGFFILFFGMTIFVYRLILREEAGIAAAQGASYAAYCAKVPRLLPSISPKVPPAGGTPNWADGFLGEAFMWTLGAAVVVFAITLNQIAYFVVLASAFVVQGICVGVITRRQKRRNINAPDAASKAQP